MRQVVAYERSKTMENCSGSRSLLRGGFSLREVLITWLFCFDCRPPEELVFIGTTSTGEILQSLSLANNTVSSVAFKVCFSFDSV